MLSESHLEVQMANGLIFHGYPDVVGVDATTGERVLVDLKVGGRMKSRIEVDALYNQLVGYQWLLGIHDLPAQRVEILNCTILMAV